MNRKSTSIDMEKLTTTIQTYTLIYATIINLVIRKAKAPCPAAYSLLPKAIAFGRAMFMLSKPSLWWPPTEIKETRRDEGDSMLTYRRAETEGY
jgi:hypothetical protein